MISCFLETSIQFYKLPLPSTTFHRLPVASMIPCIYTIPLNIEWVPKLILFVQYRLLSLPWMHAASLWRNHSVIVNLVTIHLLFSICLQDYMLYLAQFQVASTCVIFTCSQTSHVTYHVISFDSLTSHVTSHVTNPNTQFPMPPFPLWFTNMLTRLGYLPNWITCLLSSLGITPVRNPRTWTTERHGDLTVTPEACLLAPPCTLCACFRGQGGYAVLMASCLPLAVLLPPWLCRLSWIHL